MSKEEQKTESKNNFSIAKNYQDTKGFHPVYLKFSKESKAEHMLLLKSHNANRCSELKPFGKTMFVLNVPPVCDEDCLKAIFNQHGTVERVFLQDRANQIEETSKFFSLTPVNHPKPFQVAFVVFKNEQDMLNTFKNYNKPFVLPASLKLSTGIHKWKKQQRQMRIDPKELNNEVGDFMSKFDIVSSREARRKKRLGSLPDKDGWVTVTREGKMPYIPNNSERMKKIMAKEKKKRAQKELLNFYTFQVRENKMKKISELRNNFEKDKERVKKMKATRKFKASKFI